MDICKRKKPLLYAYLVFFLATSFYLYEFVLQVAPSIMVSPMMKAFHINAAGFGVISAFYFYAYAPMQLPAGLLFDRYGPRKLITLALILCAIGSIFFASTNCLVTAALGRFLIGVASSFSFVGIVVLISRWFPYSWFAFLAGIAQLMSSVGAIFGEAPLAALVAEVGWRQANFILAIIGFCLSALVWLFIRDYPQQVTCFKPQRSFREEWQRLAKVCCQQSTWIIGIYAFSIWTPIAIFAALWGVPYLEQKYQISVLVASGMCSMIWLGVGIGSPLLGWLSDYCQSRRIALNISAFCGLFATLLLLYAAVDSTTIYLVLFTLGFGAGGQTVSFAVVQDTISSELIGTASGLNNLFILLGGAIFQPLIGIILNSSQNVLGLNGIYQYSIQSYNKALVVMPVCYLSSLLVGIFLLKESYPQEKQELEPLLLSNSEEATS